MLLGVGSIIQLFQFEKKGALYYGITKGLFVSLILFILLLALVYARFVYDDKRNEVEQITKDGTFILKNKQGGTRRWGTQSDIDSNFYTGPPENAEGAIVGINPGNPDEIVSIPKLPDDANHNDLVVANMGRGKTVTYVIVQLINAILHKISFIVNDPKAEIFTIMSWFCAKIARYNTHVLNLANIDRSECWNCIRETINPETNRLDGNRLEIFVDTFMANSTNNKDKKDFWYASALNLVKAVIGYVSWQHEIVIVNNYKRLYKQITGCSENDPVLEEMGKIDTSFYWMEDRIKEAAKKHNVDSQYVSDLLEQIAKGSTEYKYNLGVVFDKIMNFTTIDAEEWYEIPKDHPAWVAYNMYNTSDSPQIRQSALQGAQMRFKLFSNPKIKEILSRDGIVLGDINKKKSAYFIITDDKSESLRPIASLFISFFYKDAMDTFDYYKQKSDDEGVENPCLPVMAMLEEFFSLGIITGDPVLFGKYMSTSRSRKIYNKIIIQFYTQVHELYGNNLKDGIESACENFIFLGCRDETTAEWVSKKIGNTTALTESHSEGTGVLSEYAERHSSMGATDRPLIYPADLMQYPKFQAIVQYAEFYPMELKTFYYKDHPVYKRGYLKNQSVYSFLEPLNTRIVKMNEEEMKTNVSEEEIRQRIQCIKPGVNLSTGEIVENNQITQDEISVPSMDDIFYYSNIIEPIDVLEATEELSIINDKINYIEPIVEENKKNIDSIENLSLFDDFKEIEKYEEESDQTESSAPNRENTQNEQSVDEEHEKVVEEIIEETIGETVEPEAQKKPKGRKTMKKKKKTTKSILDD